MPDHSSGRAARTAQVVDARIALLAVLVLGMRWALERTDFEQPQWWTVGLLVAGALLVWVVLTGMRGHAWLTLAHASAVGLAERLVYDPFQGSDVMRVTDEAIAVILRGGDPYTHFFVSTMPQGSPFAYPPGEPLFYAVVTMLGGVDIFSVDRLAGIGIVLIIAGLAALVGPVRAALAQAVWSASLLAAVRAVDGSNDTSLALLFVTGTLLLGLSLRYGSAALLIASAFAFGWAMAFKQLAWLVYPSVAAYLWRTHPRWKLHVGIALGTAGAMILPLALRSPGGFQKSVLGAAGWHPDIWGLNVWGVLADLAPGPVEVLAPRIPQIGMALTVLALILVVRRPQPDLGRALFQGTGVLAIALLAARWTTSPYYVFALAVLATATALIDLQLSRTHRLHPQPQVDAAGRPPLAP